MDDELYLCHFNLNSDMLSIILICRHIQLVSLNIPVFFDFTVNTRINLQDDKTVNVKNQKPTLTMRYLIKLQCLFFIDPISQLYLFFISRLCTEIFYFIRFNFQIDKINYSQMNEKWLLILMPLVMDFLQGIENNNKKKKLQSHRCSTPIM